MTTLTPAVQAFRESLEGIVSARHVLDAATQQRLQAVTLGAIDELKAMGWPVERIIVYFKTIAADVGLGARGTALYADNQGIMSEIVSWTIVRYYGPRAV